MPDLEVSRSAAVSAAATLEPPALWNLLALMTSLRCCARGRAHSVLANRLLPDLEVSLLTSAPTTLGVCRAGWRPIWEVAIANL